MGKSENNAGCQVHLGLGSFILGIAAGALCWSLGGSVQMSVGVAALVAMAPFLLGTIFFALTGTIVALVAAAVTARSVSSSIIADRAAARRDRAIRETYDRKARETYKGD